MNLVKSPDVISHYENDMLTSWMAGKNVFHLTRYESVWQPVGKVRACQFACDGLKFEGLCTVSQVSEAPRGLWRVVLECKGPVVLESAL